MPWYRIRYGLYRIEGATAEEAKRNAVVLLRSQAPSLISVEKDTGKKISFWRTLLLGR
jgi:hypothetical protein